MIYLSRHVTHWLPIVTAVGLQLPEFHSVGLTPSTAYFEFRCGALGHSASVAVSWLDVTATVGDTWALPLQAAAAAVRKAAQE
jgi:hypothetical protein